MKIIIAYTSAGAGHFKAAESVYEFFREKNPAWEVELVDVLSYSGALFRKNYTPVYDFMVNHAHWLWALSFRLTGLKTFSRLVFLLHSLICRINTKNLVDFLVKEKPDYIISTHFLPSVIVSSLKARDKLNAKLITVVTDFGVHPFWITDFTDIYVAASAPTVKQLEFKGVKPILIREWGIPVSSKFLKPPDKIDLCRKFGIRPDKFTVLIATGSFGIGPIKEMAYSLCVDNQVLVVCARNEKLYKALRLKENANLKVFGFISNMHELMAVSDVMVAKPGGLSISEILVMELVPLFISPIPGQEMQNLEVLAKYGIGEQINDSGRIYEIVESYKNNPDKVSEIKKNIRGFRKSYATSKLYEFVCSNSNR